MSDEKPTCKHGETGGHDDIVYTPAGQRLIYCHGPVISTPEKCKIEEESGFCDPHESYECPHGLSGDHPDGVHCDCVCHSTPTPSEKPTCEPVSEAWGQSCPGCGYPCPLCPAYLDANGNCTHGLCSKCPDPVSTEPEPPEKCEHECISVGSCSDHIGAPHRCSGCGYGFWIADDVIATPKKCKIEKESGFCDMHESYECPVIATSEKWMDAVDLEKDVRWHNAMDHLCRQIREFRPGNMMSLNLIIKANVVEFEGLTPECVSTEPETPVPEDDELGEISSVLEAFRQRNPAPLERLVEQPAATSAHGATNLAADRGSNESAFVQVGGVLEHWGARPSKTPVSDPSPELRERFFVAFEKYNSHGSHINHDDYEEMVDEISEKIEALKRPMPLYQQGARYPNHWNDALDAVLAALGEKKSNG